MKLQIDMDNKTIKLEHDANLSDALVTIKNLLPNDWKEYKLLTSNTIDWTNPIIIGKNYPWQLWEFYTTDTSSTGIYNIEVQ
jgi:hypothetical protein